MLEETELKLEALKGCLTDLPDAGYTAFTMRASTKFCVFSSSEVSLQCRM